MPERFEVVYPLKTLYKHAALPYLLLAPTAPPLPAPLQNSSEHVSS